MAKAESLVDRFMVPSLSDLTGPARRAFRPQARPLWSTESRRCHRGKAHGAALSESNRLARRQPAGRDGVGATSVDPGCDADSLSRGNGLELLISLISDLMRTGLL